MKNRRNPRKIDNLFVVVRFLRYRLESVRLVPPGVAATSPDGRVCVYKAYIGYSADGLCVVKMASAEQVGLNKTWELSLYELHRTPQDAITDNTEIAVSPRSLHSELMCPICLDMLKKTMTTKECLHRFCSDCIITALRSGNKVRNRFSMSFLIIVYFSWCGTCESFLPH